MPKGRTKREVICEAIWITSAAAFMVPAISANLESASGRGWTLTAAAVGAVLASAIFVQAFQKLRRDSQIIMAGIMLLAGLLFMSANVQNALTLASHKSEDLRGDREGKITSSVDREEQKKRLHNRREEQVRVAGEETVAFVEAAIEQRKADEPRLFRNTSGCKPEHTTREDSKAFCRSIAALKVRLAAAQARDDIDIEMKQLVAAEEGAGPKVTVADPYTSRVAALLTAVGVAVSAELRQVIAASKDWTTALVIEMMATLGPSGLLALRQRDVPRAPAPSKPAARRSTVAKAPAKPTGRDGIQAFMEHRLEEREGAEAAFSQIWKSWHAYRTENGLPEVTRQALGRALGSRFEKVDPARPRYIGVILKTTTLRLVGAGH